HDEVQGPDGARRSLCDALMEVCDIGRVSDEAVEVLASRAVNHDESQRPQVQELISALSVLQPRLYSISSSPKAVKDAVHLTVAAVRYKLRHRKRKGVASVFLAERAAPRGRVPACVRPAYVVRLPKSNYARLIMIGP